MYIEPIVKHFNTYMLRTMLEHVYNDDVYKVVSELYPKKYVSWRFPVPKGYWTEETTVKALREFVEINNLSRMCKFKSTLKSFTCVVLNY